MTPIRAQSVFDHENRIFLVAIEGLPSPENVALALEFLAAVPTRPLDVRSIAFSQGHLAAAERLRLSREHGVGVIACEFASSWDTALHMCHQYRDKLLELAAA